MDATNLVIHLFSLLSFIVLIWLLLKRQSELRFIRRAFQLGLSKKPPMLLAPGKFLELLSKGIGFEMQQNSPRLANNLERCHPGPWLKFSTQHGIKSVSVAENSGKIAITLRTADAEGAHKDWQLRLEEAIAKTAEISIKVEGDKQR